MFAGKDQVYPDASSYWCYPWAIFAITVPLHAVLGSHISKLIRFLSAEPHCTAGPLFYSPCPCEIIFLTMYVLDGVGLAGFKRRANTFLLTSAALSIFGSFYFSVSHLSSICWYCGAGVFGLGCRSLSLSLALSTSFNNNNNICCPTSPCRRRRNTGQDSVLRTWHTTILLQRLGWRHRHYHGSGRRGPQTQKQNRRGCLSTGRKPKNIQPGQQLKQIKQLHIQPPCRGGGGRIDSFQYFILSSHFLFQLIFLT